MSSTTSSEPPEKPELPDVYYSSITRNATLPPRENPRRSTSLGIRRTNTAGSVIYRTSTQLSRKETRDPHLDVNLPYRTFSNTANLEEYTIEEPEGEIDGGLAPDGQHRYKLVTFVPDDPANPKNWSKPYKWYCTMVVAITCFVVAFCSAVITADIAGVMKEFNVSEEVGLVSITVFVLGFGIGQEHRILSMHTY